MILYRTPGRSFTRPPRISTTECSCRLCPSPGMYAVTSMPLVRRTRAIFRRAEFGFFGVIVRTWVQTPRFCGEAAPWVWRWVNELNFHRNAGAFVFLDAGVRPLRISWLIVGTVLLPL